MEYHVGCLAQSASHVRCSTSFEDADMSLEALHLFCDVQLSQIKPNEPVDTTRKGSLHVERQNSAISCYAGAD
ncbi:hypothetical protein JHK85_057164 [Glycine max]|nr:hypothetical protein JHK85_057164 [Glycine max]